MAVSGRGNGMEWHGIGVARCMYSSRVMSGVINTFYKNNLTLYSYIVILIVLNKLLEDKMIKLIKRLWCKHNGPLGWEGVKSIELEGSYDEMFFVCKNCGKKYKLVWEKF